MDAQIKEEFELKNNSTVSNLPSSFYLWDQAPIKEDMQCLGPVVQVKFNLVHLVGFLTYLIEVNLRYHAFL